MTSLREATQHDEMPDEGTRSGANDPDDGELDLDALGGVAGGLPVYPPCIIGSTTPFCAPIQPAGESPLTV